MMSRKITLCSSVDLYHEANVRYGRLAGAPLYTHNALHRHTKRFLSCMLIACVVAALIAQPMIQGSVISAATQQIHTFACCAGRSIHKAAETPID